MSKKLINEKSDSTAVDAAVDPTTLCDAVDASDAQASGLLEASKKHERQKAKTSMKSLASSLNGSEVLIPWRARRGLTHQQALVKTAPRRSTRSMQMTELQLMLLRHWFLLAPKWVKTRFVGDGMLVMPP